MRRKNNSSLGFILVVLLLVGGAGYIYFSELFERNAPQISMQTNGYWNLREPLKITIADESAIKTYKIILKTDKAESTLEYEQLLTPQKELILAIESPRSAYAMQEKKIEIIIQAADTSKWNFLKGNSVSKSFKLVIDKKRPKVNIVSNSYKISRGGSALVVFEIADDNLDEIYILGNDKKKFKAQPFYKEGFYISLLAWPVKDTTFKATIVSKDKAGNTAKEYIPLYLKKKTYKVSRIKLSDKFLNGKITDLAEDFAQTQGVEDVIEQFKIINEDVRKENEMLIHDLSSEVDEEQIDSFNINKMYPLKNAQVVATFGDHRKYYYKGEYISYSYHLGLDLASNAMANIKPQNGGEVIFSDYNGLYGNMPMIHHGLGLYTIYGHCSSVKVNAGDNTESTQTIANTGKSGYAMGDHLHFGVLVQGIEVRPQEWMDTQWIKLNINDIIDEAKEIIDRT